MVKPINQTAVRCAFLEFEGGLALFYVVHYLDRTMSSSLPPQTATGGGDKTEVQIPLCRHRLR